MKYRPSRRPKVRRLRIRRAASGVSLRDVRHLLVGPKSAASASACGECCGCSLVPPLPAAPAAPGCVRGLLTRCPPSRDTCTRCPRCGRPALLRKAVRRRDPNTRSRAAPVAALRRRTTSHRRSPSGSLTRCPPFPDTCTRCPRCGPCGPGGCPPAAGRRPGRCAPRPRA